MKNLTFEKDALRERCKELVNRSEFPLKAIIVCTPANPSGKVMTQTELESISDIARYVMLVNFVGNDEQIEFLRDFRNGFEFRLCHYFARRIGWRANDNRL